MKELLIHLRAMNLFSHSAHNLVARVPFHSDHNFFGEVYEELNGEYDGVAERTIGLMGEGPLRLQDIMAGVSAKLAAAPSIGVKENGVFYKALLQMEMDLCKLCSMVIAQGATEGTKQLLGDVCNKSEMRQYKIKQRIKG